MQEASLLSDGVNYLCSYRLCAWLFCFQLLDTVVALHVYKGPSFELLSLLSYRYLL